MPKYTLTLLRAGDPKMDSARLFASSVYLDRHEAANTSPPDWTVLLEDQNGPCGTFSVFDPDTHSPLFFARLFENEWEKIKSRGVRVAEVGALAVARKESSVFTAHASTLLTAALALSMEYMGYDTFVCVANRFMSRLLRSIGASCTSFGSADASLLPGDMAHAMRNYFAANPSGSEVGRKIDPIILRGTFAKLVNLLDVDCSSFAPLVTKVAA